MGRGRRGKEPCLPKGREGNIEGVREERMEVEKKGKYASTFNKSPGTLSLAEEMPRDWGFLKYLCSQLLSWWFTSSYFHGSTTAHRDDFHVKIICRAYVRLHVGGHCLGMQTASRPNTPAQTCYLQSAVKQIKVIEWHSGSKPGLL